MTNPNTQLHAFRTFLGMPPDSDTPPVCGALITSEYRPIAGVRCKACDRAVARARMALPPGQHPADSANLKRLYAAKGGAR